MELELVIDQREHKLKSLLKNVTCDNLEVGDIVFRRGKDVVFVIERKTTSDLASSICDGRNREQKARLLNCGIPRERIMYLIEGELDAPTDRKIGSVTYSTLWGSIINTQLRDGIAIYRTSTIRETSKFLEKLYTKLKKDETTFFKYDTKKSITSAEYSATLKSQKKANMTPEIWFMRQLALIPQISEKVSSEIIKIYPSVSSLLLAYEACEPDERPKMLAGIKYPVGIDKQRKIGPKISQRIHSFMYNIF